MDDVIIYIIHTSLVESHLSYIASFISEKRKQKASKIINENDRLLSIGAGYLLKKYLPDGDILISQSGKPYLVDGPFFNISHSGEYALLAVHSTREVGVDIERIDIKKIDAIRYVLSVEEKSVTDVNTLFRIWSNKESLVKCQSTGIKDIKKVSGLPLEGTRILDEEYYSKSMIYNGYSLSITLKGNEPCNVKIQEIKNV